MDSYFLGGGTGMIALHSLAFGYSGQHPLGTLDGCFDTGSLTAIIGANGTGKSTLLKTLAGLLPPWGLLLYGTAGATPVRLFAPID